LNGDRRPDLIASEPDSGQLVVCLQEPDGQLKNPRTFPCLTGISEIAVSDWDGDGVTDVFVLSQDERQIGLTRWADQRRLPFPGIIDLEGRPLAMTVGPLKTGTLPVLAIILDRDGKRVLQLRSAKEEIRTQGLSSEFKSNPAELLWHDVDQDGMVDLVVLIQYEKVKILRQVPDQGFEEIDLAPPGGNSEQPWTTRCDVDGDGKPELMLAQKNFLRAVVLQAAATGAGTNSGTRWTFLVKEQINGASSQSRIAGATALGGADHGAATLVLLDTEQKALTLCARDATGVWKAMRNLPLPVIDFGRLEAVALGGTTNNAVALYGLNGVATQEFNGSVWELTELGSYETPIKDGFLLDVVSGDLDQDGLRDLVFLETFKHHVDLVRFVPPRELVGAVRWQVFEERSYRGQPGQLAEPRESLVADLTGDGRNDLVVLVHDRILLYPQE
jgi:hypothetical protein